MRAAACWSSHGEQQHELIITANAMPDRTEVQTWKDAPSSGFAGQ
jgi:hypothetical protein